MFSFPFVRTAFCLALFCAQIFAAEVDPAFARMNARLEQQLARADQELEKNAASVQLHSARGDACLFLGRFADAVAAYEKMIALDPSQDAPHWRLGIAYYFTGQFAKSARQFEKYHQYDGRDRENGVWKFMAQARVDGVEKARREMLEYTRFDREPFPSLYEMFAGKKTGADVLQEIEEKKLTTDSQVVFFGNYYVAINEELLGEKTAALEHIRKAVALFTPESALSGGPGYMWQVARLHAARMSAAAEPPKAAPAP